MNTTTIFRALREAEVMKDVMKRSYGKQGIAVDKTNPTALRWQRYSRMAGKFQERIYLALTKFDDEQDAGMEILGKGKP